MPIQIRGTSGVRHRPICEETLPQVVGSNRGDIAMTVVTFNAVHQFRDGLARPFEDLRKVRPGIKQRSSDTGSRIPCYRDSDDVLKLLLALAFLD